MERYEIDGGYPLRGEIRLHGAKNAVLPILAAALLTKEAVIHNCPMLSDVDAALDILGYLNCKINREEDIVSISTDDVGYAQIPHDLISEMRSSVLFLGAILSRFGHCRINFPGGCELGPRPIDLHISALRKLGAEINEDGEYLDCSIPTRFVGAEIVFPFPSVGATENAILAAVLAEGVTTIYNAAQEPEIADLAAFLNSAGAKIIINGSRIDIIGVESLGGTAHSVIPDRIAAATYLACGAITGGEIVLRDVCVEHLMAIVPYFREMGCRVDMFRDVIYLVAPPKLKSISTIKTMPYPGFPTDAQSPLMSVTTIASGRSVFIETIFQSRFKQVNDLTRMGAKIKTDGNMAIIDGVPSLKGTVVSATDLRGGASMVVAGLAAEGITTIENVHHIQRGYPDMPALLKGVGAKIRTLQ